MSDNARVLDALANYIQVLQKYRSMHEKDEERIQFSDHLAGAASIFAEYQLHGSQGCLRELVARERRKYGWSILSGQHAHIIERAFRDFAKLLEQVHSRSNQSLMDVNSANASRLNDN